MRSHSQFSTNPVALAKEESSVHCDLNQSWPKVWKMCRRFEDCLVSRTGFRIFVISVLVILVAALGLNFGYKFLLPRPPVNYNEALHSSHNSDHHILLWTPLHGSWEAWWKEGMLGGTSRTRT